RLDRFDYVRAAHEGHLIAVPGRVVDFDYVARKMREIFDRCDVQAVAFDRVFMKFLRPALSRAGFTDDELARFLEHGQGFLGMGPAIRALEERLLARKLKHGNHPLLRMCAANAHVLTDDANNRKFTKRKSTGRIDLLVALAMACGVLPPIVEEFDCQLFFVGGG
ncbi:MAG: terminase TerL endonuclease subunit, partial [Casimicrobiaceae bacterium]